MKSNFYYSFFFLPRAEKEALFLLYAFCRALDDRIDLPSGRNDAGDGLEVIRKWREELEMTYRGHPPNALFRSLYPAIRTFGLSRNNFEELINGMEMDIRSARYTTFDELKLYCYRVASAVGLLCMEIFGDRTDRARELAIHLGMAFQLTNIIRDIFQDLDKNRIYLPQEDLDLFRISADALSRREMNGDFAGLVQFQIDRAKKYYEKADLDLKACRNAGVKGIEVMMMTYARLLAKIDRNVWNLGWKRVSLTRTEKMAVAGRIWLKRFK